MPTIKELEAEVKQLREKLETERVGRAAFEQQIAERAKSAVEERIIDLKSKPLEGEEARAFISKNVEELLWEKVKRVGTYFGVATFAGLAGLAALIYNGVTKEANLVMEQTTEPYVAKAQIMLRSAEETLFHAKLKSEETLSYAQRKSDETLSDSKLKSAELSNTITTLAEQVKSAQINLQTVQSTDIQRLAPTIQALTNLPPESTHMVTSLTKLDTTISDYRRFISETEAKFAELKNELTEGLSKKPDLNSGYLLISEANKDEAITYYNTDAPTQTKGNSNVPTQHWILRKP